MRPLLVFIFALGAVLLAQTPRPQQKLPDDLPTIKVDVDVVNVLASVRDKKNALVPNLESEGFHHPGGRQAATDQVFHAGNRPSAHHRAADRRQRQPGATSSRSSASAAAQFFTQVLRKKDEAFLLSFGEEAELLQDYTNSAQVADRRRCAICG